MEPPQKSLTDFVASQPALVAAVIAASTALLVAFFNYWTASRRDRLLAAKRTQQIDHATKRVVFWQSWLSAMSPLGTPEEQGDWKADAKSQLLLAADEMRIAVLSQDHLVRTYVARLERAKAARERFLALSRIRRWLLLFRPSKRETVLATVVFYFLLLLSATAFYGEMKIHKSHTQDYQRRISGLENDPLLTPLEKSNNIAALTDQEREDNNQDLYAGIGFLIWGGIALLMRNYAVRVETTLNRFKD